VCIILIFEDFAVDDFDFVGSLWRFVLAGGHVVHIKVDLSRVAAYDDLFPPSMFDEPAFSHPPGEGLPCAAVGVAADEAFEVVEEDANPFIGKTQVSKCYEIHFFYRHSDIF